MFCEIVGAGLCVGEGGQRVILGVGGGRCGGNKMKNFFSLCLVFERSWREGSLRPKTGMMIIEVTALAR